MQNKVRTVVKVSDLAFYYDHSKVHSLAKVNALFSSNEDSALFKNDWTLVYS